LRGPSGKVNQGERLPDIEYKTYLEQYFSVDVRTEKIENDITVQNKILEMSIRNLCQHKELFLTYVIQLFCKRPKKRRWPHLRNLTLDNSVAELCLIRSSHTCVTSLRSALWL
jgi:hypothetical protein